MIQPKIVQKRLPVNFQQQTDTTLKLAEISEQKKNPGQRRNPCFMSATCPEISSVMHGYVLDLTLFELCDLSLETAGSAFVAKIS